MFGREGGGRPHGPKAGTRAEWGGRLGKNRRGNQTQRRARGQGVFRGFLHWSNLVGENTGPAVGNTPKERIV